MITFSIITPVYNREDCVSRCIESVLHQTIKNPIGGGKYEHVIVDDGSTDLTAKICKGYADSNAVVKFLQLSHNQGTNAARNAAIRASQGEFIIILDSDDYLVDDALEFIQHTIESNPEYGHYMFAPDDVDYHDSFFKGCKMKELTYPDFLRGKVKTGFIHCIKADTMRKYPFDEQVRIHEGVFFLSFYKEAQKMLFTNRVVTIRERGRSDSVTLDCVRSNKALIERGTKANEMLLERFGDDLMQYDCKSMLQYQYGYLYDNYLLLADYRKGKMLNSLFAEKYRGYVVKTNKLKILDILYAFHLGTFYRLSLQAYLWVKYKILKHKIQ